MALTPAIWTLSSPPAPLSPSSSAAPAGRPAVGETVRRGLSALEHHGRDIPVHASSGFRSCRSGVVAWRAFVKDASGEFEAPKLDIAPDSGSGNSEVRILPAQPRLSPRHNSSTRVWRLSNRFKDNENAAWVTRQVSDLGQEGVRGHHVLLSHHRLLNTPLSLRSLTLASRWQ
jgi:hypothetical protein